MENFIIPNFSHGETNPSPQTVQENDFGWFVLSPKSEDGSSAQDRDKEVTALSDSEGPPEALTSVTMNQAIDDKKYIMERAIQVNLFGDI